MRSQISVPIIAAVFLAAILHCQSASAATAKKTPLAFHKVRFTVAYGSGQPSDTREWGAGHWMAGHAALIFRFGNHDISVRLSGLSVHQSYKSSSGGSHDSHGFEDYGVLYGRTFGGERGYARAAIGLALARGEKYTKWERQYEGWDGKMHTEIGWDTDDFVTVGIPWSVQFVLALSRKFGIGFDLFGNVNSKNPFWGWGIGITI